MKKGLGFTVLWILLGLASTLQAEENTFVRNPGFEGKFLTVSDKNDKGFELEGEIAEGWSDNSSWMSSHIRYSRETANPHSGDSAQHIESIRGSVQFVQGLKLKPNTAYRFSIWLRGQAGQSVSIALRQAGGHYKTYGRVNCALTAEWQNFVVEGVVEKDPSTFLMINMNQPMQLWLDDVEVVPYTPEEVKQIGNLIPNGSFEAGIGYGWSIRHTGNPHVQFLDLPPTTSEGGVEGQKALQVNIPSKGIITIHSPLLRLVYKRHYSVSLWMRASAPIHVSASIFGAGIKSEEQSIGKEWKRITFSGKAAFKPYSWLRISAQNQTKETQQLWIDAVQVEAAKEPSPKYIAPFKHEMNLSWQEHRPGSIVLDGESGAFSYTLAPQPPAGAKLRLSMKDWYGKTYTLPEQTAKSKGVIKLPVIKNRPHGVFMLTAEAVDKSGAPLAAKTHKVYAGLPKPRTDLKPENSYFGNHIPLDKDHIQIMKRTGQKFVRLHDASVIGKWAIAEPEEGKFKFYDENIDAAHEAGLAILGMFDGAPQWMGNKDRGGYWNTWTIPTRADTNAKWENYVRTVAEHYAGRINHWEIFNEPWGLWWHAAGGTHEQYVKFMEIAFKTAKNVNPKAKIVGVDACLSQENWHKTVLKLGGTKYFDAFSYHDYNNATIGGPDKKNRAILRCDYWRKEQQAVGDPKPLWNTEGGAGDVGSFYAPQTGGMHYSLQPTYIVRYDVCSMAAGLRHFFYYATFSGASEGAITCRDTEWDRAIKPLLAARAVLASLVDGAGVPVRTEPVSGIDYYQYPKHGGQSVAVVWSYDGTPRDITVPNGARVLDVMGNPLAPAKGSIKVNAQPVYIVNR